MKIWYSFDTRYKQKIVKELMQSYACEDILVVNKAKIQRLLVCDIPFLLRCGLMVVGTGLTTLYTQWQIQIVSFGALVLLWVLSFVFHFYRLYVLHYGDFIIVTPDMINIYNQRSLINRTCKTIYMHNVAGIYVNQQWYIDSLLDDGYISIEEFGEERTTHVLFGPILHPAHVKEKIEQIMDHRGVVEVGWTVRVRG